MSSERSNLVSQYNTICFELTGNENYQKRQVKDINIVRIVLEFTLKEISGDALEQIITEACNYW